MVGGVLESVLVGAGAGLATGGIIGALMGLGVTEEDAKHFDSGFRKGGTLVTVDAGSRVDEAEGILDACNGDLGPSWAGRSEEVATREHALGTTGATSYGGSERRRYQDPQYIGPERRLVGV